MKKRKPIAMLLPYFGKFPWYFPYFLRSCEANTLIDFYIVTDQSWEHDVPENVFFVRLTFPKLKRLISERLGFKVNIPYVYKLCDIKPSYGLVFSKLISSYRFWGHGDIDVIYGNIGRFVTESTLNTYDLISSRHDYLTGYFQLYRNNHIINNLFKQSKDFVKVFTSPQHFCFDETNFTWSLFSSGLRFDKMYNEIESMTHLVYKLSEQKRVKAYFDFHAISGRGKFKWANGVLTYSPEPDVEYEIMLYHLIDLKNVYNPSQAIKRIPDTFYIDEHKIYFRDQKHKS